MKRLLLILLFIVSYSANAGVELSSIFSKKTLYKAAPCVVGLIASKMFISENASSIGLSICAVSVTSQLVFPDSHDRNLKKDIKRDITTQNDLAFFKYKKDIDQQLQDIRVQYSQYRDIIRKVVAFEIRRLDTMTKQSMKEIVKKKSFRKLVTAEISKLLKARSKDDDVKIDDAVKAGIRKIVKDAYITSIHEKKYRQLK